MSQGEVLKLILMVFCSVAFVEITFSLASAAYLRSKTKQKEKDRLKRESGSSGQHYSYHQTAN